MHIIICLTPNEPERSIGLNLKPWSKLLDHYIMADGVTKDIIKDLEAQIEEKTVQSTFSHSIKQLEKEIETIVNLGQLKENTENTFNSLTEIESEARKLIKASKPNTPVNVRVNFIETKSANKFLVALGKVLEGQGTSCFEFNKR